MSRISTVVLAASGEVHTFEEAQVFVHDLSQFVTVQLLEETPCSPVARHALQRPRARPRVGQRSRATINPKWENNLQDRHLCTSCRSMVICQF